MPAKTRTEHLNIMETQDTTIFIRAKAAHQDKSVTAIVRTALSFAFQNDPSYQAIIKHLSKLSTEEKEVIITRLQDTTLPPLERIPEEIKTILEDLK